MSISQGLICGSFTVIDMTIRIGIAIVAGRRLQDLALADDRYFNLIKKQI